MTGVGVQTFLPRTTLVILLTHNLVSLENNTSNLEHICVEVFIQNKRIVINNVYRPPNCDKASFLQDLAFTLEAVGQNSPYLTVWMGDLNAGNNYDFYALNVFKWWSFFAVTSFAVCRFLASIIPWPLFGPSRAWL